MLMDELLSAVVRTFNLCVIECVRPPDGAACRASTLRFLTPVPDWLASAFAAAPEAVPTLGDTLPFLDHFLAQAEEVWYTGHPASGSSEPFAATVNGTEVLLRAVAIAQHDRRLIVLHRLLGDLDVRPMLQKARDQALELERVVRTVGTLHAPTEALERDITALLATQLSVEQQALVERLHTATADTRAALAVLPQPPQNQRRKVIRPATQGPA
jgi:hypothetical protein